MADNASEEAVLSAFAKFAKQREAYQNVSRVFGGTFVVMGMLSIVINGTLVGALCLKKRRHAPVFYTLILNFAVVDCFKGLATILFALKLLSGEMGNSGSLWAIKVDQHSGFLLRFCNLATILNLALVTLHEYVYICYPLRYASLVTRTRVMIMILVAWIFSATVTLVNSVIGSMNRSILIDKDCPTEISSISSCIQHVDRSLSIDVIYHVGLLLFCFSCLAVTTGTYVILFRVISRLIEEDVLRQTADAPQLLRRRKFVMVIGSVIAVYLMFLVAYSSVQIIQIMHINRSNSGALLYVKYTCYVFVALHSLLQPLCYLRMKEFRLLMKNCICGKRKNGILNATEQPILSSAR